MLPARNARDLDDIPEDAREQLEFVWLKDVDDALSTAIAGYPRIATEAELH